MQTWRIYTFSKIISDNPPKNIFEAVCHIKVLASIVREYVRDHRFTAAIYLSIVRFVI